MKVSSVENTAINLITSPQTMTADWVSLGSKRVVVKGLDDVAIWLKGTLELSDRVKLRIACHRTENDANPFYTQIQTISSTAITVSPEIFQFATSDIDIVVPLGISNLAPWAEFQVMVDTLGGTPAVINEAFISFSRSK